MLDLDTLDFSKGGGFVTVVCQDARTHAVLMVARADREAMTRTIATGEMHYHSRSRGLWHKGATSGHVQRVMSLHRDCDGDAVLALVTPAGPACHTGAHSCFFQEATGDAGVGAVQVGAPAGGPPQGQSATSSSATPHPSIPDPTTSSAVEALARLATTIAARASALPLPAGSKPSYTQRLLLDRNLRLKKLGEEAAELAVACADGDRPRAAEEGADLVYHILVALAAVGVTIDDLTDVLQQRAT